jgi:hypothetical protein
MNKLLLLVFSIFVNWKSNFLSDKNQQIKLYSLAIGEYINAIYKKEKIKFDTLFIGKHIDFPNIKLPNKIQNTVIRIVNEKQADKIAKYRKSLTYLNIIENIEPTESHFLLVAFYVTKSINHINYLPIHNCNIYFKYNTKLNENTLSEIKFDYPYPNYKLRLNH